MLCNAGNQFGARPCRTLRSSLSGKPLEIKGDGTPVRSYLYGADLSAWLWTLLLHPKASGAYNVGSDEAHSILEIAEMVSAHSPEQQRITVARPPTPGQAPQRYVPDITRARRELGLGVWTRLEHAVERTLAFYQPVQTSA